MNKIKLIICILLSLSLTFIFYKLSSPLKKYSIININKGYFYQQDLAFNGIYRKTNRIILERFKNHDIKISTKEESIQLRVINSDSKNSDLVEKIADNYLNHYIESITLFEKKLIKYSNKKNDFSIDIYLDEPYKIKPEINSIIYVNNMMVRWAIFSLIFFTLTFLFYNFKILIKKVVHELKNIY